MSSSKKETKNINFFKKLFASPKPRKKIWAIFFVLVLLFSFSKPFLASAATQILTDPSGQKYIQIGTQRFNVTDNGSGQYFTKEGYLVDGGAFNDWAQEILAQQARGGDNGPGAVFKQLDSKIGDWFAQKVWDVVIGVLAVLAYFCKVLLMFGGKAMDATLNPALYNFTGNPMITGGWIMVRDICNLFFLLVLLFIAICTILKIEKYHAKKTLLMLIIMALLINFSKPIAIFVFDGSQLLMNFFLSGITSTNGQTASSKFAADIAQFLYTDLTKELGAAKGSMEIAVYYLFVVVFLFMFAVAFFVTAIFLVIRIIAVMILIIVSPFAFFAAIVPDFSRISSGWWSALFKYCYYGPAAAFFIYLATKFSLGQIGSVMPHLSVQGETSNVIPHIIQYLTVLVFLYASIIMSQHFGLAAAGAIVGNANKFMKWGAGMTKGGGMWGGAARVTGAADVYKGTKAGIAKQPGWRVLTKEGREAKSKERQEKYEGKVAPFNIATVKKKAKERENDAKEDILRDAVKGDAAAILEASRRGIDNEQKDLWKNPNIIKALGNNDLREAAYGNLRDKGKTHNVIESEIARQNIAEDETQVKKLYDTELGKLSATNLGKQDLGELSNNNDVGKQWVAGRLKEFDDLDSRLITNMLSGGHAKNIGFIRNLRNGNVLSPAADNTRGNRQQSGNNQNNQVGSERVEVVRERAPRSRTTYDANENPMT